MDYIVNKTWGYEEWLVNNELYCAKILTCNEDMWSSQGMFHYHKLKDETFYILEGKLILDIENERWLMNEGDIMRIKPNTKHRFKAINGLCKILETSTHHDDSDSYRCK